METSYKNKERDLYDTFFRASMWARIVWGFLRLLVGLGLLHLVGRQFSGIFSGLIANELSEDPNDFLVRFIHALSTHTSFTVTYFVALYLIFWGAIDIFLPINLLKGKIWAYQAGIVVIGLFVLYELYRFAHTHSTVLATAIIVDILTLWIIRHEQKKTERRKEIRK